MKLTLLLATILISSGIVSIAQTNTFPTDGNVGIGTHNPQSLLHINGLGSFINAGDNSIFNSSGIIIQGKTGGRTADKGPALEFVLPANTDGANDWGQGRIMTVAGNSLNYNAVGKMILGTRRFFNKLGNGEQWFYGDDIVIDGLGNTGIGTLNPEAKLNIVDIPQNSEGGSLIIGKTNSVNLRMGVNTGYSWVQSHGGLPLRINELGNNVLLNLNGGNVGIGTANPIDKLAVNGNIRAREIKVEAANWPDYVFDQDYKILGLQELDAYIKANKHLPGIPSASEVAKEGVELGEVVKQLLKNQEEMTLIIIQQQKMLDKLKSQFKMKNNNSKK